MTEILNALSFKKIILSIKVWRSWAFCYWFYILSIHLPKCICICVYTEHIQALRVTTYSFQSPFV